MIMKVTDFAKLSVWISAVTVIVDMTVDFFLIYGIGPIPSLGANGSAYSTIAVEAVALIWRFAIPAALSGCFAFHWPVMVVYVTMCLDEIVKLPFIQPEAGSTFLCFLSWLI